jgi:hypothetical protein
VSAPRLYRVHVEVSATVMVVATSADEAQRFAETDSEVWDNELSRHEADLNFDVVEARLRDAQMSEGDLPYIACDVTPALSKLTVKEWFERREEIEKRWKLDEEFRRRQLVIPGTEVTK